MIKDDVLQYLKDNFYLVQQGDGLVISNKFTRELGISSSNTKPIAVDTLIIPHIVHSKATKDIYKLFITEANVPSKIETSNGAYWANRYSETGYKAFAKVFNDPKINRPVLLASTKWYYAQVRTARKMIGTYFSEGIWESCYDDFIKERNKRGAINTPLVNIKIIDENASNMEAG